MKPDAPFIETARFKCRRKPLLMFLFIYAISFYSSSLSAGLFEMLSQGTHYLTSLGGCKNYDEQKAAAALAKTEALINSNNGCSTCSQSSEVATEQQLGSLTKMTPLIQDNLEDHFFRLLATQHARELNCAATFANQFATNKNHLAETLATNFDLLREAKQALVKETQLLSQNKSVINKSPCPPSLDDLKPNPYFKEQKDEYYESCRAIIKARAAYQTILSSIPLSDVPSVKKFIEEYANTKNLSALIKKNGPLEKQIHQAYLNSENDLKTQAVKLQAIIKKNGGKGFNRFERNALLSDARVVAHVIKNSSDDEDLKGLACRADARYGKGTDQLNTGLMVGSIALSAGAGVAMKVGSVAYKVAQGSAAARASGIISLNSVRILQRSALGVDSVYAYSEIDKACQKNDRLNMKTASIDSDNSCVATLSIESLEQDNCILFASLAAIGVVAVTASNSKLLSKLSNLVRPSKNAPTTEVLDALPTKLKSQKYLLEENKNFIKSIENMNFNREIYRKAKRQDDPQIKFLEDLGFTFKSKKIAAPPWEKVIERLNTKMDNLVKSGAVKEDEILYPAKIYISNDKKTKGQLLAVRFGDDVPENVTPYDNLVPNNDLARFIRDGLFPLGKAGQESATAHSALLHDLGHFSGFIADPSYMAAIRKAQTEILKNPTTLNSPKLQSRVAWAIENLVVATPGSKQPGLNKILNDLKKNSAPPQDLEYYKTVLAGKTDKEIKKITGAVTKNSNLWIEHIGGAQRDIILREIARSKTRGKKNINSYFNYNISTDAFALKQAANPTVQRQLLARLFTGLDHTSHIRPADWVRESATANPLSKDTAIYKYACLSGLFNKGHDIYTVYCK